MPLKVPPPAGITIGDGHVPEPGLVVLVVEDVVEVVVEVVVVVVVVVEVEVVEVVVVEVVEGLVVVVLLVEVVVVEEADASRTARTKAALLLPPLLPNASTLPYRKPTYHAFHGSETLDVDDQ